jgi:NADH:ubiquinone oxidoreductase subunit H
VAFTVLLERRVLDSIHVHKSPNSVCFVGLFHPFSDAFKLFTREQCFPLVSNYSSYYFSPIFASSLYLLQNIQKESRNVCRSERICSDF